MPPAIEEEEELLYESSSEHAASPQQFVGEDAIINISDGSNQPSQQPEREPSPLPVVSDIPLVVSDIPQAVNSIHSGLTAPPPQTQTQPSSLIEKGAQKPTKRKASPKGPIAKRRRGQKRDFPCTYCVRRMANDPSWTCHEAAANQFGEPYYTGARCSECVGAHVSCLSVPPHGIEPVTNLIKAAQEVVRSKTGDGTQGIALLAAYEAAIGPALRSIAGVTLPPSEKGKRGPKKKKVDKKSGQGTGATKSSSKPTLGGTNSGPRPWHEDKRPTTQQHRDRLQQPAGSDPAHIPEPTQSAHDPETFERMERQALRRRKVEALESLAHTTALFLAEFMDFRKGQQAAATAAGPSSTSNRTGGPPRWARPPSFSASPPRVEPGAGSAYAAAAAGMSASLFQPPAGEEKEEEEEEEENGWQHDGAGEERSGGLSDSEDSASNSDDDDDDGDIPARVALDNGNADEEVYDSEETGSEDVGDYKMGSETDQEGPNVKVEDE